jgi:hypothetical protein
MRCTPSTPQFLDILERLRNYAYSNPVLPPTLYQLINPKPATRPQPPPTVSDDGSTQSGMSSVTGATGLSQLTKQSRYGSTAHNPSLDPTLTALLPPTIRVKDLIGNDEAPKNESNAPMCLSYHLWGLCFTSCRRKADHNRPLTPTDKATLSNWVIDHLAKCRASGAIPP